MSTVAPRPSLSAATIVEKISQYWRVSVVEVTGSTQDDLSRGVIDGSVREGDVLLTEFQSTGRGRLDRKFEAAHSSALLFSFYIEPQRDRDEWGFLPLLTGLSVVFALSKLDPHLLLSLKWPNDLLVGERKIGGILTQGTERGVIIGIGINVAMSEDELPVPHASSLAIANFRLLDRNLICAAILNAFEELFSRWQSGEDLRHLYQKQSSTIGRHIRVEQPGGKFFDAQAVDISPQGELILDNGSRVTVGDVIHLR